MLSLLHADSDSDLSTPDSLADDQVPPLPTVNPEQRERSGPQQVPQLLLLDSDTSDDEDDGEAREFPRLRQGRVLTFPGGLSSIDSVRTPRHFCITQFNHMHILKYNYSPSESFWLNTLTVVFGC